MMGAFRKDQSIVGTRTNALLDTKDFERKVYQQNKRGRLHGPMRFLEQDKIPVTPFEQLRLRLELTRRQWAEILQVTAASISHIDNGKSIAGVPLAKRMQEEARQRGVAITLDELYQHVIPWNLEQEDIDTFYKGRLPPTQQNLSRSTSETESLKETQSVS